MQNRSLLGVIPVVILLQVATGGPAAAAPSAPAVQAQLLAQTGQLRASGGLYVQGLAIASGNLLPEFYAARAYAPVWNRATLEAAIARGKTQTVRLPKPWPVLILYWTAELDQDGRVRFLPDVYGRDAQLLRALNGDVVIDFPSL